MRQFHYKIYVPGGNTTALVKGTNFTKNQMKHINDKIQSLNHPGYEEVEQVGFLSEQEHALNMAGGEFCGNATRSSAYNYLQGIPGFMNIRLNGNQTVSAGVYTNGHAWCEIPLYQGDDDMVLELDGAGIHLVKMQGMVTVVIQSKLSMPYLEGIESFKKDEDKELLKQHGLEIMQKYGLMDEAAAGIMFLKKQAGVTEMFPIVRVKAIDTLYAETACGSGTAATAIVESYLSGNQENICVKQPSGQEIFAETTLSSGEVSKVVISGVVSTDDKWYTEEI